MKILLSSSVSLKKNIALKGLLLLGPLVALQLFAPEKWALHCRLHQWTGLPCPGCGTTRCLQLLLEGHFIAAGQMQPLIFCAAILLGTLCLYSVLCSCFSWPAFRVVLNRKGERHTFLLLATAAVFGNWIYLISQS